jgi:RNA-binding protein YhbY
MQEGLMDGDSIIVIAVTGSMAVLSLGAKAFLNYFHHISLKSLKSFANDNQLQIIHGEHAESFVTETDVQLTRRRTVKVRFFTEKMPLERGINRITRFVITPAGSGDLLVLHRDLRESVQVGLEEIPAQDPAIRNKFHIYTSDPSLVTTMLSGEESDALASDLLIRSIRLTEKQLTVELFGITFPPEHLQRAFQFAANLTKKSRKRRN